MMGVEKKIHTHWVELDHPKIEFLCADPNCIVYKVEKLAEEMEVPGGEGLISHRGIARRLREVLNER